MKIVQSFSFLIEKNQFLWIFASKKSKGYLPKSEYTIFWWFSELSSCSVEYILFFLCKKTIKRIVISKKMDKNTPKFGGKDKSLKKLFQISRCYKLWMIKNHNLWKFWMIKNYNQWNGLNLNLKDLIENDEKFQKNFKLKWMNSCILW